MKGRSVKSGPMGFFNFGVKARLSLVNLLTNKKDEINIVGAMIL